MEQFTYEQVIKAMESGEADYRHAEWMREYVHSITNRLHRYQGDIEMCTTVLGLEEGELVSPKVKELVDAKLLWEAKTGRCYECGKLVMECVCE